MMPAIPSPDYLGKRMSEAESLIAEAAIILEGAPFHIFGKKIRAKLALLSSAIYNDAPRGSEAIAAACEIVHLASLIHDDIVDDSQLRRGMPSLNSLQGSKRAVLAGDLLLSQALKLMVSYGTPEQMAIITETALHMASSQIEEMDCAEKQDFSEKKYLDIISGKTASLMEASCRLGALCAKAEPPHLQALAEFGRNFGMAYQLYDDFLDIWGDESIMGKPAFSDIYGSKCTLPVILAWQDEKTRKHLQKIAAPSKRIINKNGRNCPEPNNGETSEKIADIDIFRKMLSDLHIPQKLADLAKDFMARAKHSLIALPDSQAKAALMALPESVISFEL